MYSGRADYNSETGAAWQAAPARNIPEAQTTFEPRGSAPPLYLSPLVGLPYFGAGAGVAVPASGDVVVVGAGFGGVGFGGSDLQPPRNGTTRNASNATSAKYLFIPVLLSQMTVVLT